MNNIRLRALEPEDLDMLYRLENDRDMWDVGITNTPYSRYALHNFIATATGDIYTDRQVRLMVTKDSEASSEQTLGMADLFNFDPAHRRAEVGIVIAKAYRQCGYARQALNQLHSYAHRTLHLHQVYAIVSTGNLPAIRLFRSLEYVESAHLCQWLFNGNCYTDAVVMQKILDSPKNC